MKRATILIVEDKESMAQMLTQAIESENYQVIVAKDGREGIQKFKGNSIDLVVTDLRLPHKTGLEILEMVKEHSPLVPVILMTAYGTIETAVKAVKEGAYDFLTKPFDPDHLLILIGKALEKKKLVTENIILREEVTRHNKFPKIIGKSPALMDVMDKVQKVAPSHTTVLLLGESGTGKELFARSVHQLSLRNNGPFVAINCAAIPHDLLESELFGHEKGAFTGAVGRKLGKFELASQGTLFLDEIGDMDISLQAKLLRVLEGVEFMRVGGVSKIKVDVRLVAATNQNLQARIANQLFREDLYYRVSVFPITIPPLRERKEDIPELTGHFLRHFCDELKKPLKTLSKESLDQLMEHPWSGNVRELQNVIERTVILTDGDTIGLDDLGLRGRKTDARGPSQPDLPVDGTLQEVGGAASRAAEDRLIRKVLKETGGNKTRAAENLQVSYKTLLTKIKDYGIES